MKSFISWNVNGIRACETKGLFQFLQSESPDFLCLQETKAHKEQLTEKFINPPGYRSWFAQGIRKGYSGVAVYVREGIPDPVSVATLGIPEFDDEGRTLLLEYPEFTLITAYFPNSQPEGKRLDYKIRFCEAVLDKCDAIVRGGSHVILCGDYNVAHKPIDLAHPKQNEQNPGYLPEERAWMDKFTESGYSDTFRQFNTEPGHYTWWTYRMKARERNVGWRIDYVCVDRDFASRVKESVILDQVMGSDHCPVRITLS